MAYPAGVSLAVVNVGTAFTAFGADVGVEVTVTPKFPKVGGGYLTRVVHAATGWVMTADSSVFKADAGTELSFSVPHVDQSGFRDPSQAAYTGWYYEVKVSVGKGKQGSYTQTVQPLIGQALIDLDLVPDGPVGEAVSAPVATVTSVNGQTGAVVVTGDAATDEALAANLTESKEYTDAQVGAIEDSTLQEGGDPGVAFAVVDETGRRTWIESDLNGDPTEYSANKLAGSDTVVAAVGAGVGIAPIEDPATEVVFSVVDDDGRRTELELGPDGKVPARILNAWGSRMGNTGDYPKATWAAWGDSLTESSWPGKLATSLGVEVYNGGVGGQKIGQVAARQGGTPARVTLDGGAIPATGPVNVTNIVNTPLSPGNNHGPGSSRRGTIAGIDGTLSRPGDGTTHTFTRTTGGDVVPVPAGTYFLPVDATLRRDRVVTIWAGRNDLEPSLPDTPIPGLLSRVRSMIDYLTPAVKRVMVLEIPPYSTETFGSGGRVPLDAYNDALQGAFPELWVPIASWLRTQDAATAAGITFTAQDDTDIANGVTPTSFRSDDVHLSDAGNTAVAARIKTEAQTRGWI